MRVEVSESEITLLLLGLTTLRELVSLKLSEHEPQGVKRRATQEQCRIDALRARLEPLGEPVMEPRYPETELRGEPLGAGPLEAECDNCAVEGRGAKPAVVLGDGLKLCVDCWQELKDDCELIEGEQSH